MSGYRGPEDWLASLTSAPNSVRKYAALLAARADREGRFTAASTWLAGISGRSPVFNALRPAMCSNGFAGRATSR